MQKQEIEEGASPTGAEVDALDKHLAEFDAAATQRDPVELEPTPETVDELLSDPVKAPVDPYDREAVSRANMESQAQTRAAQLDQRLAAIQQREYERQEEADFADFSKTAQDKISEYLLPPDFAERFLMAEAIKDPLLRECWFARNDPTLDAGTMQQVRRYLSNTIDKVVKAAASIPDREATEDRFAVVQAVRGASAKVGPEPPPDLSKLSDAELRKYTRDNFGYEAPV